MRCILETLQPTLPATQREVYCTHSGVAYNGLTDFSASCSPERGGVLYLKLVDRALWIFWCSFKCLNGHEVKVQGWTQKIGRCFNLRLLAVVEKVVFHLHSNRTEPEMIYTYPVLLHLHVAYQFRWSCRTPSNFSYMIWVFHQFFDVFEVPKFSGHKC